MITSDTNKKYAGIGLAAVLDCRKNIHTTRMFKGVEERCISLGLAVALEDSQNDYNEAADSEDVDKARLHLVEMGVIVEDIRTYEQMDIDAHLLDIEEEIVRLQKYKVHWSVLSSKLGGLVQ